MGGLGRFWRWGFWSGGWRRRNWREMRRVLSGRSIQRRARAAKQGKTYASLRSQWDNLRFPKRCIARHQRCAVVNACGRDNFVGGVASEIKFANFAADLETDRPDLDAGEKFY